MQRKLPTHRYLYASCCLWLALPGRNAAAHETHQLHNQTPPSHEMPARQLEYATRIPPSQWELLGVVEARDMERLLLRRTVPGQTREPLKPVLIGGSVDYTTEHFQNLAAPDLIKLEVSDSGLKVLHPPAEIVVMQGYGYILPLLVANHCSAPVLLSVATPWRSYEFPLPGHSIRGFCLNLPRFFGIGKQQVEISLRAGEGATTTSLLVDVRPTGTLTVRLLDAGSGLAAARVYLTGSDGLSHMPLGGLQRISRLSGEYFFYAEGGFKVVLPEGEAFVEAVRGMEYAPVQKAVEVRANQDTILDLRLDHRLLLKQQHWYSGDAHIHANLFNQEIVGLEDIHLQVSGEGLDVANLMVSNSSGAIIHDERFFEGKPHVVGGGSRVLYWNEEMRNRRLYGHMSFFNLKQLVHPLYTGFSGTPHWEDYPPNYTQARKARAQDGAVTYVHPAIGSTFAKMGLAGAREFPVDLALGQVDALDVVSNTPEMPAAELWYRVLNTGLRCALSAGSDSFTNIMMHWVPGGGRVYVKIPGEFSYQAWIDNYRKGRSFVTNGPFLTLRVKGKGPGEELQLSKGPRATRVTVEAEVISIVPLETLEIIVNGSVVRSHAITEDGGRQARIVHAVALEKSSWIAARALGPGHRLIMNDPKAFAHTGPVFCYLNNQPIRSPQDARFWITWIDELIEDVKQHGTFATDQRRDSVIALFRKAQAVWADLAR